MERKYINSRRGSIAEDVCKKTVVFIILVFASVIIMMMSQLNPLYEGTSATDSSVFKYVALVMSKGGMPYRDTFDHKGPLLYILNYIGLLISYYRGIWVIELLFMVAFLIVLYRTARLFCERFTSVAIVLLCCSCLNTYFAGGGNYTEEYSMLFIAGGIYIFLDYFINNKISRLRLVICGLCFGAVAMLRANMVAIWVVFSVAVLIQSIWRKDKKWRSFLIWFLIGTAVIVVPILIWLAVNGAFGDFISDYVLFNMKYSSDGTRASIVNRYNSAMVFLSDSLLLGSIVILIYFIIKKDNLFLNITYLIGILFSVVALVISGQSYAHYGLALIPLLVYPYAKIYSFNFNGDSAYKVVLSILLVSLTFGSWQSIGKTAITKYYNYTQGNTSSLSEEMKEAVSIIKENTTEDDRIIVLGNSDIWYVLTRRLAASEYSYQSPIAAIDEEIMAEFLEDLDTNEPAAVVAFGESDWLSANIDDYEVAYSYTSGDTTTTIYLRSTE